MAGLSPATLYHFRIVVTDSSGNTALGKNRTFTTLAVPTQQSPQQPSEPALPTKANEPSVSAVISPAAGGGGLPVAPHQPRMLSVTALDGQVAFEWYKDKGRKNGLIQTIVIRKQGKTSVESRIDGEVVYDGPLTNFTDTNVENGTEYHYALYSYGVHERFTAPVKFKIIPQAGNEQVNISAAEVEEETTRAPEFSRDLFRGRLGDDVVVLQTFLKENGYYPEALVTGFFGSLTQRAVIRYQKLNGIIPSAGYVGPITRSVLSQE